MATEICKSHCIGNVGHSRKKNEQRSVRIHLLIGYQFPRSFFNQYRAAIEKKGTCITPHAHGASVARFSRGWPMYITLHVTLD